MYGGRAIDDFDRRVLKTYMDEYMGDFIFDTFQPFHFFQNHEFDYHIPEDGSRDSYIGKLHSSPIYTHMSSSYRSSIFGLSHWDPYAMHRGGCLELSYCNMVEWSWWDSRD